MINSIFSPINTTKTIKQTKELLEKYPQMKFIDQISVVDNPDYTDISAQSYDGMPSSQDNTNHEESKMLKRLKEGVALHYDIASIENTIESMNITDRQVYLAHILKYHFIKGWSVVKCCRKLSEDFPEFTGNSEGALPVSTFYDHQKEALLAFAIIYKSGILLVQKSSE